MHLNIVINNINLLVRKKVYKLYFNNQLNFISIYFKGRNAVVHLGKNKKTQNYCIQFPLLKENYHKMVGVSVTK